MDKISPESFRIAFNSWRYLFFKSKEFKEMMGRWKELYDSNNIDENTMNKSMIEAAAMASRVGHKVFKQMNNRDPDTSEKMEINDAVVLVQEFITYWGEEPDFPDI